MTICFFGASSVEGACDTRWGGFVGRYAQDAYARGVAVQVFNLGIGGQTTRDFLARSETELVARAPEIVVFSLGSNDMPRRGDGEPERRVPLAEFRRNLGRLFSTPQGARRLLVTLFPVDPARTGIAPETFQAYVELSRSVAREHDVEILDLYDALGGVCHPEILADDGLHLNADGYAWVTTRLLERLP